MNNIKIIDFDNKYAEELSDLITQNLLEVNIKDYSKEEMENLAKEFTSENIIEFNKARKIFIAMKYNKAVGTISIAPSWGGEEGDYHFLTIFVLPEYHKCGIGKIMVEYAQSYVERLGVKKVASLLT